MAKMYREVFSGLLEDPASVLAKTFPSEGTKDIVLVHDIPFYSMCEHHFVPFFGKAHIAYIPKDRILGLSKFARLVDIYAKRPQVQEKLTNQIAQSLEDALNAEGVIVVVEAEHLCMSMRGIKKPGSSTTTVCRKGVFATDAALENRFFNMLGRSSNV
jgi:GTP cyclohydrolase I